MQWFRSVHCTARHATFVQFRARTAHGNCSMLVPSTLTDDAFSDNPHLSLDHVGASTAGAWTAPMSQGPSLTAPPPSEAPSYPLWWRWFAPAALAVLIADQLSKWWLFALPADARLPGFISRVENRGVAWSIGHNNPGLVVAATLVLIPLLSVIWWIWFRRHGPAENLAFGLILGGALGNAIDRVCAHFALGGLHGVRDFISVDLGFPPANPWPTFNIADSGITVGFLILVALSFVKTQATPAARTPVVSDP